MNLRMALSRLDSAEARVGVARALALFCAIGYILSLAVLFATGIGLDRWLLPALGTPWKAGRLFAERKKILTV